MELAASREPDLPALSWLVDCVAGRAAVRCGPAVEMSDDGIVDGCWTGAFGNFDFDRADYVFGTGMRLRGGTPVFVPPCHSLEALYVWLQPSRHVVSNSLAFLCEHCGLDLPYAAYGPRMATVVRGVDDYRKEIHRDRHGRLLRLIYDRFFVVDGELTFDRPEPAVAFTDFASYRAYFFEMLRQSVDNACDPRRRRVYELLSSCSSGYDSSAIMVLAAELGCRTAATIRLDRRGRLDSGRPIAEALGMTVHEAPGLDITDHPEPLSEPEFIASGIGGDDVVFAQLEHCLANRVLITGHLGGVVWGLADGPKALLERSDVAGASLGEYRLRLPFLHIPAPLIGITHKQRIHDISLSDAMAPYRVGGDYDRPIPRRILESAGIPRTAFAQEKRMVASMLFVNSAKLSPATRRAFQAEERRIVGPRRLRYLADQAVYHIRLKLLRWSHRLVDALRLPSAVRTGLGKALVGDYRIFEHSHPRYGSAIFLWALRRQRACYRRSVDRVASDEARVRGSAQRSERTTETRTRMLR